MASLGRNELNGLAQISYYRYLNYFTDHVTNASVVIMVIELDASGNQQNKKIVLHNKQSTLLHFNRKYKDYVYGRC